MIELDPSFRPVRTREGYLPFENLGVIGDGSRAFSHIGVIVSGVTPARARAGALS
jgi:hypothetical protein